MRTNNRYKSPFTIYVVWHPSFKKGQEVADFLYASFTRDTEAPLKRGIGIPVYYRSVAEKGQQMPKEIPLNDASYNAIIVLIDDYLFNDDSWNKFVKNAIPKCDDKNLIFPVAFSSNAYFFEETTLGTEQFINLSSKDSDDDKGDFKSFNELRSRLLHGFCRLLLGKKPLHKVDEEIEIPAPVKLFISHAKKDGEKVAIDFRDFVRARTKLNTFFDANDIADGYKFDTQIKKAIEEGQAALVVFHSDVYATREWCQIEVLTAKRYKAPIVVVHNINIGEGRSFPYLGNVPTIKLNNENFDEIIDLALYQILINIYQGENLKRIRVLYLPEKFEGIELTSPPELFNFLDILSKKDKSVKKSFLAMYPDPPLGIDEMKVLNDMDDKIQFLTPIQLSKLIK